MAHSKAKSLQQRINAANRSGFADPWNGLAREPFLTIPHKYTLTIFPIALHLLHRNYCVHSNSPSEDLRPVLADERFFSRHVLKNVEPYRSTHVEYQNEVLTINEREANTNY